jgi:fibronectin type 3 domain-containing protein
MPIVFLDSFLQKTLTGFGLCCSLCLIPTAVHAATTNAAKLQWAANSDSDIAGYKVYQGKRAGSYGPSLDVKNVTTYTVSNLQAGLTHFFAITAYDLSGNESYPSTEVSKYIADSSPVLTPQKSKKKTKSQKQLAKAAKKERKKLAKAAKKARKKSKQKKKKKARR